MIEKADLPTTIYVARFKDIFWNNNSDLYPNNCPPLELYTEVTNIIPIFHTPYSGTITLTGLYNHAVYKDTYYHLIKLKLVDLTDNTYQYQLEYDVMLNLLNTGAEISGRLIKTNNKEILEQCLQTTTPILTSPTENISISFKEVEDSSSSPFSGTKIIKAETGILDWYISNKNFSSFIKRIKENIYFDSLKKNGWHTSKKPNIQQHTYNPLFIIDYLQPALAPSWENRVIKKVNAFLEDLKTEEAKTKYQITKLNLQNSEYHNRLCITHKEGALGTTEETNYNLEAIDLSNLTKIEPLDANLKSINLSTGIGLTNRRSATYTDLYTEDLYETRPPIGWYIKLCRNPHLPLKPLGKKLDNELQALPIHSSRNNNNRNDIDTGYTGNKPQLLRFKKDTNITEDGWLWYINRLDFSLVDGFLNPTDKQKPFSSRAYIDYDKERQNEYFFTRLDDRKKVPGLGFLIYQHIRPKDVWDDYQYTSSAETNTIFYRSGLNINLFRKTSATNRWFSYDGNKNNNYRALNKINGIEALSKFTLLIDQFRWLLVAPSYKELSYKFFDNNYWGYRDFFKNRGSREIQYPVNFLNYDIEANGEHVRNLLTNNPEDINKFFSDREQEIQDISLTTSLDITSLGLNKLSENDIFCFDLDWTWKRTPFIQQEIPVVIDAEAIKRLEKTTKSPEQPQPATHLKSTTIAGNLEGIKTWRQHAYKDSYQKIQQDLDITFSTPLPDSAIKIIEINKTQREKHKKYKWLTYIPIVGYYWSLYDFAISASEEPRRDDIRYLSSIYTIGDFFGSKEVDTTIFDGTVVVYLHKGKAKLGVYKERKANLELNPSPNNILESVEGTTSRETKIYQIKHLLDIDINQPDPFTEDVKLSIISNAYSAARGGSDGKIYSYTEQELETGAHYFELVGTGWIVGLINGKVHLIDKLDNKFKLKGDKKYIIASTTSTDNIKDKSIYEKINQQATLVCWSAEFPLNTKFKSLEDNFTIYQRLVIGENTKNKQSLIDTYHIELQESNHDYINTLIPVFKKTQTSLKEIDLTNYELLKNEAAKLNTNYWQSQQQNQLLLEEKKLQAARSLEDLDIQWSTRIFNAASNVATGAGIGLIKGGAAGAAKGAGIAALHGISSNIMFYARDYYTYRDRIKQDELLVMRNNSMSMFNRKQNYEHEERSKLIQLNSLTNSYVKPTANEIDVQRDYNALDGTSDIHLNILFPSDEQTQLLEDFYERHGSSCDYSGYTPTSPLKIACGTLTHLYQFSKVETFNSTLSTDQYINETVRLIFQNGVRFLDYNFEVDPDQEYEYYVPTFIDPEFNTNQIPEWTFDVWDRYVLSTPKDQIIEILKSLPNYGLTEEEYTTNKDRIDAAKDDDEHLFDLINDIIGHRKTGTVYLLPPPTPEEKDRDVIHDLKKKIADCEETLRTTTENCLTSTTALNTEIDRLKGEIDTKKEELRQCNINLTNIQQAKETCDRINAAEQKKLKAEIGTLKQQLAEKTRERDELQTQKDKLTTDLQTCTTDKTTLQQNLDTKTQELTQCQTSINNIQQQLNTKTEELRQCNINLTNIQQAKETCDRINAEEQKRLRAEIETLKQQLATKTREKNDLNDQLQLCQSEKNTAQADLEAKTQELQTAQTALTTCQSDLASCQAMPGANQDIKRVWGLYNTCNKNLQSANRYKTRLSANNTRLQRELDEARRQIGTVTSLRQQIAEKTREKTQLEEQLNTANQTLTQTQEELKTKTQELATCKAGSTDQITTLTDQIKNLQQQLTTCTSDRTTIQQQLTTKTQELETCNNELRTFTNVNQQLSTANTALRAIESKADQVWSDYLPQLSHLCEEYTINRDAYSTAVLPTLSKACTIKKTTATTPQEKIFRSIDNLINITKWNTLESKTLRTDLQSKEDTIKKLKSDRTTINNQIITLMSDIKGASLKPLSDLKKFFETSTTSSTTNLLKESSARTLGSNAKTILQLPNTTISQKLTTASRTITWLKDYNQAVVDYCQSKPTTSTETTRLQQQLATKTQELQTAQTALTTCQADLAQCRASQSVGINNQVTTLLSGIKDASSKLLSDLKNYSEQSTPSSTINLLDTSSARTLGAGAKTILQLPDNTTSQKLTRATRTITWLKTFNQAVIDKNQQTSNARILEIQNLKSQKQDLERQIRECLAKPTPDTSRYQTQITTLTDQIKNLQQQLTTCTSDRTTIQQQLTTKTQELQQCKEKQTASEVPNACELLQKYLKEPDLNNTYADELVRKLAENIHYVQLSHLDEKLKAKYPLVAKIFPLLKQLEQATPIWNYLDAMNLEGWDFYTDWQYNNKTIDKDKLSLVMLVSPIVNTALSNLTAVQLKGIKAILDEIAYLSYEAKLEHEKKNKKDPDNEHRDVSDIDLDTRLQYFFTKVVGNYSREYKNLYGEDLDNATRIRKFLSTPCVAGSPNNPTLKTLDNYDKQITYTTTGIPEINHPPGLHYWSLIKYPGLDVTYPPNSIIYSRNISDITAPIVSKSFFDKNVYQKLRRSSKNPGYYVLTFLDHKTGYTSQGHNYIWVYIYVWSLNSFEFFTRDQNFGFYIRNADPNVTYDEAQTIRNQVLAKFHNRLDQENLRQYLRTQSSVMITIKPTTPHIHIDSSSNAKTVSLGGDAAKFDLIAIFGKEDAYYALYVILVLSWYKIIEFKQVRDEPKYWNTHYVDVYKGGYNDTVDAGYEHINQSLTQHFERYHSLQNYIFFVGFWCGNCDDFIQYVSLTVKHKKFFDLYPSKESGSLRSLLSILPT